MLGKIFRVCPIEEQHMQANNFREQLAVLWPGSIQGGVLLAHKSLVAIGDRGSTAFNDNPWDSWKVADSLIEEGAVGFYHTHPPEYPDFSVQDWEFIEGLAQVNGKKLIWHVMQPCGLDTARIVCAHMRIRGHVDVYDLGHIQSEVTDTIIGLVLPPVWERISDSMSISRMIDDE